MSCTWPPRESLLVLQNQGQYSIRLDHSLEYNLTGFQESPYTELPTTLKHNMGAMNIHLITARAFGWM